MSKQGKCQRLWSNEACVNKNVYSFKETVPIAVGHNHTSKIIKEGRLVCLKPWPGSIQYSGNNQTFSLYLNASKAYFVGFVGTKFQLVPGNPTAFPKTIMKISATAGTFLIYLKVKCKMSCVICQDSCFSLSIMYRIACNAIVCRVCCAI